MIRLYRAALYLLPAPLREQHGDEMTAVFEQQLYERLRRDGRIAACRTVRAELGALAWFAWCARRGAPAPARIDERMLVWHAEAERTGSMGESIRRELRSAVRLLARTPGFSVICVLTFALAIGANTAVFSVVHGVLLRPLPYPDAQRLVVFGHHTDGSDSLDTTTPGNFYDWKERATAFAAMAAFAYTERVIAYGDTVERLRGVMSAGSIFDVRSCAASRICSTCGQVSTPSGCSRSAFLFRPASTARRRRGWPISRAPLSVCAPCPA